MTATTLSLNSSTGTATTFRAWGSGISAGFAAVGLVQTADTGQINWTTVAAPTAAGTAMGYEIWRFADTLQATKPIFIKVEYGAGGNTQTPQMWVTVGTGTDGAGTLTSMAGTGTSVTPRYALGTSSQLLGAVTGAVYVSTPDSSAIGLLAWPGYGVTWGGMMFLVERTRDPDGTANSDGFILIVGQSSSSSGATTTYEQRHFSALVTPSTSQYAPAPGLNQASFRSVSDGSTLYPIPVFTGFTTRMGGPSKLVVAIGKGDVPVNTTFTMTQYGAAHLWMSAGGGTTGADGWGGWSNNASAVTGLNSFAMRMD
jgi:hypothetical protein